MAYDQSTQTTSKAVFDRIITKVTDSTFMGGSGNVWTKLAEYQCWPSISAADKSSAPDSDATKNRHSYVLKGVGDGTDEIFVGLAYSERGQVAPFASGTLPATGNIRLFGFQKFTPIINDVTVFEYQGAWSGSSVDYVAGDVTTSAGLDYLCIKDHTSDFGGNSPTAPDQTAWTAKTPFIGAFVDSTSVVLNNYLTNTAGTALFKVTSDLSTQFPAYSSGTTYSINQVVTSGGGRYFSVAGGNVNHDPATNPSWWTAITDAQIAPGATWQRSLYTAETPFKNEWTFSVKYSIGDWVTLTGFLYECATANTSTAGNTPTGDKGGTYWAAHTPHYKSQKYGNDRLGQFTEDEGFIDQWQSGLCWSGFHKMWQSGAGNIPMWLCANTRRFMWVTKSSTTRWNFSYVGFLKAFGTDCTNPYPLLLAANATSSSPAPATSDQQWLTQNVPYDFVEEDNTPGIQQWLIGNYPITPDASRFCRLDLSWVTPPVPYPYSTEGPLGLERLPTGENYLREVWLHDGTGFVGALDGVYWVAAQGMASGDILTANSQDYLIVEDVYRASSGGVFAIALA